MFLNIFLLIIFPIILIDIIFNKNQFIKNLYNKLIKNLKIIILNISYNWSEAAGLDNSSEGGSEFFSEILIIIGIFTAFFSFVPYFITLNSDFSLIFSFSILIILLSVLILIPLTYGKIIIEVINNKTPKILIPILLIIELVSYLFKILSLTIRISVNNSTGHALSLIFFTLCYQLINYTLNYFGKIIAYLIYLICLIYMIM